MIDYIFDNAVAVLEVIVTGFCVIVLFSAIVAAVAITLVVVEELKRRRGHEKGRDT